MADDLDSFLDGDDEEAETPPLKLKPMTQRDAYVLRRPASASVISQALGMDRRTVVRRLENHCPPVGYARNAPLYDFIQALPFLVRGNRKDLRDFIKTMNVGDLPQSLQKDVWDARLKEQQWREKAGDLWRSADVMEVFSDAFQALSATTKLWTDQIAEEQDLPNDVRDALSQRVDDLQKMLHERLVQLPHEKVTRSQLSEIEEDE